jgi:hypothetical protein
MALRRPRAMVHGGSPPSVPSSSGSVSSSGTGAAGKSASRVTTAEDEIVSSASRLAEAWRNVHQYRDEVMKGSLNWKLKGPEAYFIPEDH